MGDVPEDALVRVAGELFRALDEEEACCLHLGFTNSLMHDLA